MEPLETPANRGSSVPAPDLTSLDDAALKAEIDRLTTREREISFQRRYLHGQIELARNELMRRLEDMPGGFSAVDLDELNRILDEPSGGR